MGPSSATQLVALLDVGHSMAAAEWSSISSDVIKTNGKDPLTSPTPTAGRDSLRSPDGRPRDEPSVAQKHDAPARHFNNQTSNVHRLIEEQLIAQILEDREISSRIDDFYFEHHVLGSPMYFEGWRRGPPLTRTLADSYTTFTRLRELGIRAHSWV